MTRFKEGARIDRALETGRPEDLRWALAYAQARSRTAATERHRRHWEAVARKVSARCRAEDQIAALRQQVQRERGASGKTLAEVEALVALFPSDPEVWVLRGDVIQLGDGTGPSLAEAKRSYEYALSLQPNHREAADELRHFLDVHGPDV